MRGEWQTENDLHWRRDVTLAEDASRVHTGSAPRAMASLRSLAIGVLTLFNGMTGPARVCRHVRKGPPREELTVLDIEDCLTDILAIPGALDALVIEDTGGMPVAAGRTAPHLDPQTSAAALSQTFRATLDGLAVASPDGTIRVEDVIVTSDKGHHLLRPVETAVTGPILLYLRLDLERSNLALARHRLRAISDRLISA
ncbi:hypothetical protein [Sphaerisporangium perillae]|uniref:hypothetical protein n=1 Tax=Sphaerisporangium perillae TaxID=2935860 RepID=UPI0035589B6A